MYQPRRLDGPHCNNILVLENNSSSNWERITQKTINRNTVIITKIISLENFIETSKLIKMSGASYQDMKYVFWLITLL